MSPEEATPVNLLHLWSLRPAICWFFWRIHHPSLVRLSRVLGRKLVRSPPESSPWVSLLPGQHSHPSAASPIFLRGQSVLLRSGLCPLSCVCVWLYGRSVICYSPSGQTPDRTQTQRTCVATTYDIKLIMERSLSPDTHMSCLSKKYPTLAPVSTWSPVCLAVLVGCLGGYGTFRRRSPAGGRTSLGEGFEGL